MVPFPYEIGIYSGFTKHLEYRLCHVKRYKENNNNQLHCVYSNQVLAGFNRVFIFFTVLQNCLNYNYILLHICTLIPPLTYHSLVMFICKRATQWTNISSSPTRME